MRLVTIAWLIGWMVGAAVARGVERTTLEVLGEKLVAADRAVKTAEGRLATVNEETPGRVVVESGLRSLRDERSELARQYLAMLQRAGAMPLWAGAARVKVVFVVDNSGT